jgi:CMP-N-acetylneuraminic acid synthetase
LAAETVTRVIVSTDDEEIATIARQYGAEVPFLRPQNYLVMTHPICLFSSMP